MIPTALWRVQVGKLDISAKALVALRQLKTEKLGDIDGISVDELHRNLGPSVNCVAIASEINEAISRLKEGRSKLRAAMGSRRVSPRIKPELKLTDEEENQPIFIPTTERGRLLAGFPLSVRLSHILDSARIRLAGELHGRKYGALLKIRNCGRKTIIELREIVRLLQAGSSESIPAAPETAISGLFVVADNARALKVDELPIPVRLRNVLEACGVASLGDLAGRSESDVQGVRNCGRTTILQLRSLLVRAATGEFSPRTMVNHSDCLRELARAIDVGLSASSARNRAIFELRLNGKEGQPQTLEDVGVQFGMTRERVRQIVKKIMLQVRQAGVRCSRFLDQEPTESKTHEPSTPQTIHPRVQGAGR